MGWRPSPLRHFLDAQFRLNSSFELVLSDRLSAREKETFAVLHQDPDFYGILRPLQPGLVFKSVCRDTALLLYSLLVPGPIPHYVRELSGTQCGATIAKLVLDRVLEIDVGSGFLSGAAARPVLFEDEEPTEERVLAPITVAAMKYAQALNLQDTMALSARLYAYNRLPISPGWRKRFPSEAALVNFLDIEPGGRNQGILNQFGEGFHSNSGQPGWLFWHSREKREIVEPRRAFKLYVSPMVRGLPEAFRATLEVATETAARAFKVGKDVSGILRPDKLVVYYSSREEVEEATRRLTPRLRGLPGHRVPFTGALDDQGLLSWGMDPPRRERLVPWQGPSWRCWLTDRLALALIGANGATLGSREPWQLALDRLSLENVDIMCWAPADNLWETSA